MNGLSGAAPRSPRTGSRALRSDPGFGGVDALPTQAGGSVRCARKRNHSIPRSRITVVFRQERSRCVASRHESLASLVCGMPVQLIDAMLVAVAVRKAVRSGAGKEEFKCDA